MENKNENAATMFPGGFMVMGVLKCLNFSIYCEDTELDHMKNRTGRTADRLRETRNLAGFWLE